MRAAPAKGSSGAQTRMERQESSAEAAGDAERSRRERDRVYLPSWPSLQQVPPGKRQRPLSLAERRLSGGEAGSAGRGGPCAQDEGAARSAAGEGCLGRSPPRVGAPAASASTEPRPNLPLSAPLGFRVSSSTHAVVPSVAALPLTPIDGSSGQPGGGAEARAPSESSSQDELEIVEEGAEEAPGSLVTAGADAHRVPFTHSILHAPPNPPPRGPPPPPPAAGPQIGFSPHGAVPSAAAPPVAQAIGPFDRPGGGAEAVESSSEGELEIVEEKDEEVSDGLAIAGGAARRIPLSHFISHAPPNPRPRDPPLPATTGSRGPSTRFASLPPAPSQPTAGMVIDLASVRGAGCRGRDPLAALMRPRPLQSGLQRPLSPSERHVGGDEPSSTDKDGPMPTGSPRPRRQRPPSPIERHAGGGEPSSFGRDGPGNSKTRASGAPYHVGSPRPGRQRPLSPRGMQAVGSLAAPTRTVQATQKQKLPARLTTSRLRPPALPTSRQGEATPPGGGRPPRLRQQPLPRGRGRRRRSTSRSSASGRATRRIGS